MIINNNNNYFRNKTNNKKNKRRKNKNRNRKKHLRDNSEDSSGETSSFIDKSELITIESYENGKFGDKDEKAEYKAHYWYWQQ